MKFQELSLEGAFLIELDKHLDERGYFARTFCVEQFLQHGLVTGFIQMSTSFNKKKGQIRGMHYQEEPFAETKLVRCTKGAILDVILDLRPNSKTFKQSYATHLSASNGKMLYIPKGFAHGYQTLEEETEVFYMMDQIYVKDFAREISYKEFF